LLCVAAGMACRAQGLSISGKVRSTEGPLEATVTLRDPSRGQRITQANGAGEYSFSGLDNGPYQVTFEHCGYRTATFAVALSYDPESGELNVSLEQE